MIPSVRVIVTLFILATAGVNGQTSSAAKFNRQESAVPPYTEPRLLQLGDGTEIRSARVWEKKRRPLILQLLRSEMFGFPAQRVRMVVTQSKKDPDAFNGLGTRMQVTLAPAKKADGRAMHLLIYLPNHVDRPVPVFLGLNYSGNQSVSPDPDIDLGTIWIPDASNRLKLHPELATAAMRGKASSEWPIETMLKRGYGFATLYDGDLEPDFDGGKSHGFRSLTKLSEKNIPEDERWGAIAVWAWGLSRALDYLVTLPAINAGHVIVIGHSRLGKAALWAGAQDKRFSMVISNESGKGGASLMKRNFGETVDHLNSRFPYWFDARFHQYSNDTNQLPFDSHFLLALIAPRPLYIASAAGDYSLDSKGEYQAAHLATAVYHLFGQTGVESSEMPAIGDPIMHRLGYHIRDGKHDMTAYDWERYLDFADLQFASPHKARDLPLSPSK